VTEIAFMSIMYAFVYVISRGLWHGP